MKVSQLFVLPIFYCLVHSSSAHAQKTDDDSVEQGTNSEPKDELEANEEEEEERKRWDNYLDLNSIKTLQWKCPELKNYSNYDDLVSYRYDEQSESCFSLYGQGPCGSGMRYFIQKKGSIYGNCDCDPSFIYGRRMNIYDAKSNACYPIFSQGICSLGLIMDLTSEGVPTCTENPCGSHGPNFFRVGGVCAEINKPNKEICGENEDYIVSFIHNQLEPGCKHTKLSFGHGTVLIQFRCTAGTVLSAGGNCQTVVPRRGGTSIG